MRETVCAITPRSCENRLNAMPRSATSSASRSRICFWMVTSSAVVGSSALDVTIQKQILDLLAELVAERGMALILISHDLGVIAQTVSRMLVMYGGSVVESGPTAAVFAERAHPYTQGLFAARPALGAAKGPRLATLAGRVPELVDLPPGCPFAGRCAHTVPACHATVPPPTPLPHGHVVRCIRLPEIAGVAA